MKTLLILLTLLTLSTAAFAGGVDRNSPYGRTQQCINDSYPICNYQLPNKIKPGFKITNPCMVERIAFCYCEYQNLNCPA